MLCSRIAATGRQVGAGCQKCIHAHFIRRKMARTCMYVCAIYHVAKQRCAVRVLRTVVCSLILVGRRTVAHKSWWGCTHQPRGKAAPVGSFIPCGVVPPRSPLANAGHSFHTYLRMYVCMYVRKINAFGLSFSPADDVFVCARSVSERSGGFE